ncbi:dimethylarginine dimethylaminohydrolase family protein [Terriglobus sp. 2YAB30_2]|uniref:dimethylarginine dimethylaminohydrolase family protein n=2 Tax=unclassified Terriglobus TaxID=2628988 RepID=UPI003F985B9B
MITEPDKENEEETISGENNPVPALLMCPPRFYDVSYVINPWMRGNLGKASLSLAMQQWQKLCRVLSGMAHVLLVEPVAGSPDMVFTANAGLAHAGIVVISSFYYPERQNEETHFRRWFTDAGYRVADLPREIPFEGEGDALFSSNGLRLWVGYGYRTRESSHAILRDLWAIEVAGLHLVDPRFYHLDTCFAPLKDGSLLYFPPAFDKTSVARIEAYYPPAQRIVISEEDAMSFACNAVNIGKTIVLNRISSELECKLKVRGFQVIQVELSEFLKAGGAAKCLVMQLTPELHLQPLNHPVRPCN